MGRRVHVRLLTWTTAVAVLLLVSGCSRAPQSTATPEASPEPVRIAVEGAANSGVSIAASGSRAVVTWAATVPTGTNVYAAVSTDGGATFGAPVRVNDVDGDARVNGEQPPRVAIGADIVVAWVSRLTGVSRIRMARSVDGGRTFTPAATAHSETLAGARGWQSLAIDTGNRVHAAWLDGRDANRSAAVNPPTSARPVVPTNQGAASPHAMHRASRQDIFHAVWRPDGRALEARVATDVCFCCKTSVATGPDQTTYVAFRHIYPTNLRDMAVARSIDGGRTFDAPVRVSEDQWQINGCPEDGPSIAVGADGTLHIAWPTLIQSPDATRKAIFYSYSTDHGRTFAPRMRVDDSGEGSRTAAHPQLAVAGSNVVVVWDESGPQGRQVRLAEITSSSPATWTPASSAPLSLSGEDRGVYPAVASVSGTPIVAWTAEAADAAVVRVLRIARGRE
jgi:hypothetical protein